MVRRVVLFAVLATGLAGCGGGGSAAVPSSVRTPTLYVAAQDVVNAFPSDAAGPALPQRQITGLYAQNSSGAAARLVTDIAAGTDGTLNVLETSYAQSGNPSHRVRIYGPDANGAGAPQAEVGGIDGRAGQAIARVPGAARYDVIADGIHVESFAPNGPASDAFSVQIPPHAGAVQRIAIDASGSIYLSVGAFGVGIYAPGSSGIATPMRSIGLGPNLGAIAVGADGTAYVIYGGAITPELYVAEIAPGASSVANRLGPYSLTTGLGSPVGLAVDAHDQLYVAFLQPAIAGSQGPPYTNSIQVFAPGATGNAAPIRTIANPIARNARNLGAIVAIAIGQ